MKQNVVNNNGFTLIELLVVVLIIGVLTSVALPGYRKSVEKSRVTDALTTMQAVAKSEHGWYLTNNNYTKDFANLDIDLIDVDGEKAEGESYDTVNYTFTLQDNSIMAQRSNNEYTLYKMYEDPNIYCLPQDHYICEQFGWGVNRSLCNNIEGAWSNKTGQCYNSEQARCVANNENGATWYTDNGGWCGFKNKDGVNVTEFQECINCRNSTFTGEGAKCNGTAVDYCRGNTFSNGAICDGTKGATCNNSIINKDSQCISNNTYGCESVTVNDGGKCVIIGDSWLRYACQGTYSGTGCCEGPRCPGSTPKCDCPIDESTGMHKTSC